MLTVMSPTVIGMVNGGAEERAWNSVILVEEDRGQ